MKIAIIYSSKTGNTKTLAETIKEALKNQNLVYFNTPSENIPTADIYIIGSWTFKGSPTDDIVQILKKLKNKKIAYFGTAGYGDNTEYYHKLFERVKPYIDSSNEILGYFYCQGKMPIQIKTKYEQMLKENPEETKYKKMIATFDNALYHPNEENLNNVKKWINQIIDKN